MARAPIEQRTCPECGFVAKNVNGLRGHRQFKHGIPPASRQVAKLEQPERLIIDDIMEQLQERFVTVSDWDQVLTDICDSHAALRDRVKLLEQKVAATPAQIQQLSSKLANLAARFDRILRPVEREFENHRILDSIGQRKKP